MDLGISGKRAAVAAGSAGLGLASATALAQAGVRLAICGRDQGRLDDAVAHITAAAPDAEVMAMTRPQPCAVMAGTAAWHMATVERRLSSRAGR